MNPLLRLRSATETRRLGRALGATARRGDVLLLAGPLGAGKTELVRGLVRGAGLSDRVRSPSFTLVNIYASGPIVIHHVDLYRITGEAELDALGLDEIFAEDSLAVVEWPDRLGSRRPAGALELTLTFPEGAGGPRLAEIRAPGPSARAAAWRREALERMEAR